MKIDFLFKKGFKIFMSFIFLTSNIALLVSNSDFFETLDDFSRGFIHGIQLSCLICWIIYLLICAFKHETPFVRKGD